MDIATILKWLQKGKSVAIIGPTNAGKSYFVEKLLLPHLRETHSVVYFKEADYTRFSGAEFAIFDEVETFVDRDFLEKRHPEEYPYYSDRYVEAVEKRFRWYSEFSIPSIYIITRNHPEEIRYLTEHFRRADWDGREIVSVRFYS